MHYIYLIDPTRIHQLPRHVLRSHAKQMYAEIKEDSIVQSLSSKKQRQIRRSPGSALAAKMLLQVPRHNLHICSAVETIWRENQKYPGHFFLVDNRRYSSLREEFLLFCQAAEVGKETDFAGARAALSAITALRPAPAFVLPTDVWRKACWKARTTIAMFDPTSQLIFMQQIEDPDRAEHIALHEMIHSLQKHRFVSKKQAEKTILLEGLTEAAATNLHGDYGFYQKEREQALRALERSSYSLKDLLFLSGEKMYDLLGEDIGQENLDRLLRP